MKIMRFEKEITAPMSLKVTAEIREDGVFDIVTIKYIGEVDDYTKERVVQASHWVLKYIDLAHHVNDLLENMVHKIQEVELFKTVPSCADVELSILTALAALQIDVLALHNPSVQVGHA